MEGAQAVVGFYARTTKVIHGLKDASRQLVSGRGTGDNVLPDPIEVSDIFVVDGSEWSGVFFPGVETLCPRVYSVHDGEIDLFGERIDGGNVLVKIRETDCRQTTIGHLLGRVVYIDANAADGEGPAFVVARRFDQNTAELAPSRDEVVGPFEADLVNKSLLFERLEHR